ncbi:MAG: hypothetical protein DMF73_08030 [Acidobacteria bacterium]|nr:MAG: hypothetical protein DMF73_08030 [Acidobacteriota bacterium]
MAHSQERFSAGVRRILQAAKRAKGKEQGRRAKLEERRGFTIRAVALMIAWFLSPRLRPLPFALRSLLLAIRLV